MRLMKHYRILAVTAAVLLAASCNSLLNKSPLGNLAVENYYTTHPAAFSLSFGFRFLL